MSDETLMTAPAATTTEGLDASQPAGQEGATAAPESGEQQAAQGSNDQSTEGAPEAYEFKAPEGQSYDEQVIGAFSEVAKDLNLTNDQAQKVLDKMAPVIASRQSEQIAAVRDDWASQSRADKEFGGDKLDENLGVARKAMDAFASPELRGLLNESGLGNHPEVIRMFYRAGKAISEDGFVAGKPASGKPADARSLYSKSNMNP